MAVNLLELRDINEALSYLKSNDMLSALPMKEQCSYVARRFKEIADRNGIEIRLIKKK